MAGSVKNWKVGTRSILHSQPVRHQEQTRTEAGVIGIARLESNYYRRKTPVEWNWSLRMLSSRTGWAVGGFSFWIRGEVLPFVRFIIRLNGYVLITTSSSTDQVEINWYMNAVTLNNPTTINNYPFMPDIMATLVFKIFIQAHP